MHAETVSGDITIDSRGERVRRLSTGTVSGDAQARVGLRDGGQIKSETVSGDIRLRLPKDLSARVSGESFSGDLDAPGAKVRKEEFGPGKSFEARYGSGAGEIRMETFSGDAELILGDLAQALPGRRWTGRNIRIGCRCRSEIGLRNAARPGAIGRTAGHPSRTRALRDL